MDMQREKQVQRLTLAEKHLTDMENSYERINKDTNLLKEVAARTDVDEAIREMAQEFINFQTNR